ncbi:MAG: dihydroorotase [Bdellovibrionales bacterium]|nr:dihydroorotase [Bdellovibrionales bacterium]
MSSEPQRLLIQGGRVLDPASGLDGAFDILVEGQRIAAVDKPGQFTGVGDVQVLSAKGLLVTPGLVDIHVHLREPGQEWKETVLTGSRAAVAGGFTTVCCMPNTKPVNDAASVTEFILEQAERANLCRVHPIGAITLGLKGESLAPYLELAEAGCVAFSDDGRPVTNSAIMRKALEYNFLTGAVLTVHEEDLQLSEGFSMNESARSVKLGLKGMPDAAENVMIARDIELARLTGGRVHFCHVSTARGVTLIRRAKEDGIPVTAEVLPHNFTLDDSAVEGFDTQAKMSMPLRSPEDVAAMAKALQEGVIDCIASDHAPHEADSKNVEFDKASFGILGLQTTLPLTLAKVRSGEFTLMRAIEALTVAPAKCLNLSAGTLAKGALADITFIDLERSITLEPKHIRSKSKNTPFYGWELQGLAAKTMVGGRLVFDSEEAGE